MSYTVLARKWRPQTFADVKGQEAVVATLSRALDTGRVAHAYLFTGSRGVGKTTIARVMAKALCCERGITSSPCGTCTACTEITAGSAVDVIEIDGASHTGVDDIRELREVVRYQPQRLRFKVFIIDEVHMLSTSAFNALLKTLEEPPPHVKFIFATTEPHKIPVTILSRCQRYDFKRIPAAVIVERLREVLTAEGLRIADDGLAVIARAAEGGMRDALSLTDQVLSFAGEDASADAVTEALGLIDRRTLVDATVAVLARDTRAALAVLDRVFAQGHDLRAFVESIATELRHLAIARATGSVQGFVDLSDEDIKGIDARAAAHDGRDLQRLFHAALEGTDLVAESENAKLAAELVVLKLCERPPVADASLVNEALVRLDALVRGKPVPPLGPGAGPRGPAEGVVRETLASSSRSAPSSDGARAPAPRAPMSSDGAAARPAVASPPGASSSPRPAPPPTPPPVEEPELADEPALDEAAAPVAAAPPPSTANDDEEADLELDDADPALGLPLEGVDARFKDFIDRVWRKSDQLGAHLAHARFLGAQAASGGVRVLLAFDRGLHERAVKDGAKDPVVVEALASVFGEGAFLETGAVPETAPPTLVEAQKKALDDVEKALDAHARAHPVVKKALELFGGEVRSVRRAS